MVATYSAPLRIATPLGAETLAIITTRSALWSPLRSTTAYTLPGVLRSDEDGPLRPERHRAGVPDILGEDVSVKSRRNDQWARAADAPWRAESGQRRSKDNEEKGRAHESDGHVTPRVSTCTDTAHRWQAPGRHRSTAPRSCQRFENFSTASGSRAPWIVNA